MKVAVSYISSKYKLTDTVKKIDESNADYIHVDLMDGKFVENKNFTIGEVTKLLGNTKKMLDVHLMTLKPEKYVEDLALLNTEFITFHIEAVKDPLKTIEFIKNLGLRVGIAINPETDIKAIEPYFSLIDQILVMSVTPGKGGQEFIPDVFKKIDELIELKEKYNFIISVDGGINERTITELKNREIDMAVSGSYICQSDNFNKQISNLKEA